MTRREIRCAREIFGDDYADAMEQVDRFLVAHRACNHAARLVARVECDHEAALTVRVVRRVTLDGTTIRIIANWDGSFSNTLTRGRRFRTADAAATSARLEMRANENVRRTALAALTA